MRTKIALPILLGIIFSTLGFVQFASASLLVRPANLGILKVTTESFPYIVTKSFVIGNYYDYPINIKLSTLRNISSLVQLDSTSFALQPNETKAVNYTVTLLGPGAYEGGVSVIAVGNSTQASIAYEAELRIIANQAEPSEPQLSPQVYIAIILVAAFIIAFLLMKGTGFLKSDKGKAKNKIIFASIFFLTLFFVSGVNAKEIAMVVPDSHNLNPTLDQKVYDILTQMGHNVFLVDGSTSVDYSNFDLIVVVGSPKNNLRLGSFAQNIPVNDVPTIAIDAVDIAGWGWVKPSGISILYTSGTQRAFIFRDHPINQGLPVGQKVDALIIPGQNLIDLVAANSKLKTIDTVNSDSNLQLIAYGPPRTLLFNGKQISNHSAVIHFGISYSVYWTSDTEKLFKNSINFLLNMEFEPPTIPLLSGPSTSQSKNVQYTWTASSDVSGIQYYEFQLAKDSNFTDIIVDTQTTSLQYTATNLAIGNKYYARVRAADWFDVTSDWSNVVSTVIDNTNIIVTIIEPHPNINVTLGEVIFTKAMVQATLALQGGCSIKIGSESIGSLPYDSQTKLCSGNVTIPTTLGQSGLGTSQFTVSATNVLGSTNSSSVPVFFDRSLKVTVATGQSSYTTQSFITASGKVTVADNNAPVSDAAVSFNVAGKSISGSTTTDSNGVYSISFSNPGIGSYTLQVTATYGSAHQATSSTTFSVTSTQASTTSQNTGGGVSAAIVLLTIDTPKTISGYEGEDVTFNVKIKNDGDNLIHGVKVQLKDLDFLYDSQPTGVDLASLKSQTFTITIHLPDLSEGSHEFRVWGISRETNSYEKVTLNVLPKKLPFIRPVRIELPIFYQNEESTVNLTVENAGNAAGDVTISIELPDGWSAQKDSITANVDVNKQVKLIFLVTPASNAGTLNFVGTYSAAGEEKTFMEGTNVTVKQRAAPSPFTGMLALLGDPMFFLPVSVLVAAGLVFLFKKKKIKVPTERILLLSKMLQNKFAILQSHLKKAGTTLQSRFKKVETKENDIELIPKPRKINLASNYEKWEKKLTKTR